jgi:hypothetical protein
MTTKCLIVDDDEEERHIPIAKSPIDAYRGTGKTCSTCFGVKDSDYITFDKELFASFRNSFFRRDDRNDVIDYEQEYIYIPISQLSKIQ